MLAAIPFPNIDPVIVHLGPIAIRWYGMAYVTGFFLAYAVLRAMIQTGKLRITRDQLSDMVTWLAFGVIAGGRLGWYFIYYRPNGQPTPWYEPFALWKGGMSFHGGLIGVMLGLIIWSHFAKAPFWNLADCLAKVTPIGLFLGRIANFINAELVGRPTNLPWGVIFPIQMKPLVLESFPRHPSQLYEAILEGPILMAAVWLLGRRVENRPGVTAGWFLILYGIFRFAVEFTRQPDPQLGFIAFGWLTMGQLLSVLLALFGVAMFLARWRRPPQAALK